MQQELLVPLAGVLIAAVVAAVTSLVVSILSKDQKTSEFRQAWIDALREDAANLAGQWSTMISTLDAKKAANEDPRGFLDSKHDDIANLEVRIARMRLRLNPKEHSLLIKHLHDLGHGSMRNRQEMDAAIERIVVEVQKILRREWKRVKRGEPSFWLLKWGSLVVVVSAAAYGWRYFEAAKALGAMISSP